MLLALLIAAAPWLEMSGGPVFIAKGTAAGGSGSMLRLEVGVPLGERVALEAWLSGAIASAPRSGPYDAAPAELGTSAVPSLGLGGRLLLARFADQFGVWAHGGAGWAPYFGYGGRSGPTAFGGALLSFQPFVKRFSLGLEADAVVWNNILGPDNAVALAVLPSLRCSF